MRPLLRDGGHEQADLPDPGRAGGPDVYRRAGRAGPAAPVRAVVQRHCLVLDPPDAPGRWPGPLVEWRQASGAWQGRVVYVTSPAPGESVVVEAWLPAPGLRAG